MIIGELVSGVGREMELRKRYNTVSSQRAIHQAIHISHGGLQSLGVSAGTSSRLALVLTVTSHAADSKKKRKEKKKKGSSGQSSWIK